MAEAVAVGRDVEVVVREMPMQLFRPARYVLVAARFSVGRKNLYGFNQDYLFYWRARMLYV